MELKDYIVVYLKPGELYAGSDPVVIKTVLGSCVSVCLHDKVNKQGGANHYLLATDKNGGNNPYSYGEKAIPELVDMVIREGGEKRNLVAKVIGGSCSMAGGILDVGQANIAIAKKVLAEYSIPIVYEDTGGPFGRVIRFYPHNNELYVRRAGEHEEETLSSEENIALPKDPISVTKDETFVQLTPSQINLLGNIFSIGLQRAQSSLSSMLGTPALLEVSEVMLRPIGYAQDYVSKRFSDFIISTGQKDRGTVGEILMMMEPSKMMMIVNGLLRRDLQTSIQYDRMESSVMIELANIVINAILGTLANHLGFAMMLRVPKLTRTKEELATIPFMLSAKQWKLSLATKARLSIPSWKMDTLLLLLIELSSTHSFFEKMGMK